MITIDNYSIIYSGAALMTEQDQYTRKYAKKAKAPAKKEIAKLPERPKTRLRKNNR